MARALRRQLDLDGEPVGDHNIAEILELPIDAISSGNVAEPLKRMKMSLGLPNGDGRVRLFLHQPYRTARRFYLSRLVGEHLLNADSLGNWLPATFGATWRQKYQRAFASEFLCPIEVLKERLGPDRNFDEYEMETIAENYGLGVFAVKNHWDYNSPRTPELFEEKYSFD
jgi:hypothetical protein